MQLARAPHPCEAITATSLQVDATAMTAAPMAVVYCALLVHGPFGADTPAGADAAG